MKESSLPQFNTAIFLAGAWPHTSPAERDRLLAEIRLLKVAALYGDNIDLISTSVELWRDRLTRNDINRVCPNRLDVWIKTLCRLVSEYHLTKSGQVPDSVSNFLDSWTSYTSQIISGDPHSMPSSEEAPELLLETWAVTADSLSEDELPGFTAVKQLIRQNRLVLTSPVDTSILSSTSHTNWSVKVNEVNGEFSERDRLELERMGMALITRLESVITDPQTIPIFDQITGEVVEGAFKSSLGSSRRLAGPLAASLFAQIPNFERASLRDIIDIRTELNDCIRGFRRTIAQMSIDMAEIPDSELNKTVQDLWATQVLPELDEINYRIRRNRYLWQLTETSLSKPEGIVAGGLALSTVGFGLATNLTIPSLVASGVLGAIPAAKAAWDCMKTGDEIRQSKFYFVHQLAGRLDSDRLPRSQGVRKSNTKKRRPRHRR
jgi:hypothetical protein